jgi:hypothetical protein
MLESGSRILKAEKCAVERFFARWVNLFAGYIPPRGSNFSGVDLGGEAQGAEGFVGGFGGGSDVDKHQRLGVAPQGGLQQVGELGVAEGHVALLVSQRHDHVACITQYSMQSDLFKWDVKITAK